MSQDPLSAADGFVIAMLTVMTLSFGIVILLIVCGLRAAARRNPDVDDLLEEVAAEDKLKEQAPAAAKAEKPLEAWEREGDWWKK